MSTAKFCYRGVAYSPAQHESRPPEPVEHVYRGQRYMAPLRHAEVQADPELELHYRGSVYHHRVAEAAAELSRSSAVHQAAATGG
jgi:hypothetical protein